MTEASIRIARKKKNPLGPHTYSACAISKSSYTQLQTGIQASNNRGISDMNLLHYQAMRRFSWWGIQSSHLTAKDDRKLLCPIRLSLISAAMLKMNWTRDTALKHFWVSHNNTSANPLSVNLLKMALLFHLLNPTGFRADFHSSQAPHKVREQANQLRSNSKLYWGRCQFLPRGKNYDRRDDAFPASAKAKELQCIWSTPATICYHIHFSRQTVAFRLIRK